jgi:hypothetical protein
MKRTKTERRQWRKRKMTSPAIADRQFLLHSLTPFCPSERYYSLTARAASSRRREGEGRTFELLLHDRVIHPRILAAPGEAEAAAAMPLAALAG